MALLLLLVATVFLAPHSASACSCMAFPDDEAEAAAMAYGMADAVFLGEVTEIRSRRLTFMAFRDASFDVLQAWKGLDGSNPAVVRSAKGEIACGYRFQKPGKYLVFAYWDSDRQILTTSMCDLTREASKAAGLIRELEKISPREASAGGEEPAP